MPISAGKTISFKKSLNLGMKSMALKLLSLLMALNIALSGMGIAFYEHTCLKLGEKDYALSNSDFCNENQDASETKDGFNQGRCCQTDLISYSYHPTSDCQDQSISLNAAIITDLPASPIVLHVKPAEETLILGIPHSHAPPAPSVGQFLAHIQSYLI